MRCVSPVRRLSVGIVTGGFLVSLSASGAAGMPILQSLDQDDPPQAEETWTPQDSEPVTSISVPASAIFEFSFAVTSAIGPDEQLGAVMLEDWAHPLPTGRLLSQYGNRGIIPGVTTSAFHNGIDLAAPFGTEIHAAGAGTVTYVGNGNRVLGLTGWVIVIEHNDGTSTAYNHMYEDGVLVEVGDEVDAGDVIGLVGSAGNSTGPHLHFSAWVDGKAVNPVNYLRERGIEVPGGRETKDETVFGDPYEWDWGPAPVGDGEPIDEPIGTPEPDPVPQQPSDEEAEPDETPTPEPTPSPEPTPTPTPTPTPEPTPSPTPSPEPTPTPEPTPDPTPDPGDGTPSPSEDAGATEPEPTPSSEPSTPPAEDPTDVPPSTP